MFVFLAFVVLQILTKICSDDITPLLHLENQQALVKQFSEIIEFVLKFDEYKVSTALFGLKTAFRRWFFVGKTRVVHFGTNFRCRCELRPFKTISVTTDEC